MGYIGYIFAFYATNMGSSDSGETNGEPHRVQGPPWSLNGPCHGPTIHPSWLYFCILCNKYGIKGLWRQKGQPLLVLGPLLVLQWTLPWPYNAANTAQNFCILRNKNGTRIYLFHVPWEAKIWCRGVLQDLG